MAAVLSLRQYVLGDHFANTVSDDVCNLMAMLNELILCINGMLCLSDESFSISDVEQLILLLCAS